MDNLQYVNVQLKVNLHYLHKKISPQFTVKN